MPHVLTTIEGRVLGALLEKERTVPDQYPLSLNATMLACNQATNREPVMSLGEREVEQTLTSLKTQGLVRFVHPTSGRGVTKYRQVFDERLMLEPEAIAVVCVLLLRGPQTPGELRTRGDRLHDFESVEAVERVLSALSHRDEPLVERLERQPGQSQTRWRQLVADEPEFVAPAVGRVTEGATGGVGRNALASEVETLRSRVDELEARLAALETLLA